MKLTPRELQLLRALTEGCTTKEAAARLGIDQHHAATILSKAKIRAGAGSNEQLVLMAVQDGWLGVLSAAGGRPQRKSLASTEHLSNGRDDDARI